MKTKILTTIGCFGLSLTLMSAQDNQPTDSKVTAAQQSLGRDTNRDSEALTDAQKGQVSAILGKYNSDSLNPESAMAIQNAFKKAGIKGGKALNEAVQSAGFQPDKLRDLAPPPSQGEGEHNPNQKDNGIDDKQGIGKAQPTAEQNNGQQSQYTIYQAISERAQLSTIAFSGLAFLTGDFGAATFMPPGKVCDFFGFQYMRDIDAAGKGHNPMFLTRIAGDVLSILNANQRQLLSDLAAEQAGQFEKLAFERMPLIKAFQRAKDGEIPDGSSGLNLASVKAYAGKFYTFDAELSFRRAEVFGKVVNSLSSEQKATFARMKFGDFNTWPDLDEREALKRQNPTSSRFFTVAYMTFASEFFSWYAGSTTADTYFCPERHGTYFGSFYMKDMPAMNKRNYNISTAVTGDSGETFIEILTPSQRVHITTIPERQKALLAQVVKVREAISVELRKFLGGGTANRATILALGKYYGELDGEMSYIYASAYSQVGRTLTAEQKAQFVKLRNLDGYVSAPAYLYSNPLRELPSGINSDFLFFPTTKATLNNTNKT